MLFSGYPTGAQDVCVSRESHCRVYCIRLCCDQLCNNNITRLQQAPSQRSKKGKQHHPRWRLCPPLLVSLLFSLSFFGHLSGLPCQSPAGFTIEFPQQKRIQFQSSCCPFFHRFRSHFFGVFHFSFSMFCQCFLFFMFVSYISVHFRRFPFSCFPFLRFSRTCFLACLLLFFVNFKNFHSKKTVAPRVEQVVLLLKGKLAEVMHFTPLM